MNKGVSEEVRNQLAEKFGNKIGEKEFIIIIELLTEEEKVKRQEKTDSNMPSVKKEVNDGLKLHINDSAKEFTVQMIDGENITLFDMKSKVVLLNFWATWCAPCLMELYEIPNKILEPFKDSKFISISRGESKDKVRKKWLS